MEQERRRGGASHAALSLGGPLARARRQAEGIPLPDGVWQSLLEAAEDAGMSRRQVNDAMAQERATAESDRR